VPDSQICRFYGSQCPEALQPRGIPHDQSGKMIINKCMQLLHCGHCLAVGGWRVRKVLVSYHLDVRYGCVPFVSQTISCGAT
jgi:hypothetical protein